MKIRKEELHADEQQARHEMAEWTAQRYRTFNDWVAFREGDPMWLLVAKLTGRFFGIAIMVILSPFIAIGLLLAFIAVF
ncbi:MAG: hypothetical protein HUU34_19575 [Saprospiraceae bacterium]|jgi:hypothetical protein|nr:hypothetical protein [Saprospiraceae bacterium]